MRGWGSIPAGGSPPLPREKPSASGWALRVPSAAAGVGPIVCSPGEAPEVGGHSGGPGPRGADASPPGGPCLPLPPLGSACLR